MALTARMQNNKQWFIKPSHKKAPELAKKLKISTVLAQLLINRRIQTEEEAKSFLTPRLNELIEPEKMPGIAAAVQRIAKALKDKQKIAVYGDYDVDGITGTAILCEIIKMLGGSVQFYIPHRVDEGYGLNENAIKQLASDNIKLIITVDCGISAVQTAQLINQLEMDLIITDHHQPPNQLPNAKAIVHPLLDNSFANPNCSGSTVAFKLAWALANNFKKNGKTSPKMRQFLLNATMLAAMGSVADVVDMTGENRILTSYGLKALPQSNLKGIKALIQSAGLQSTQIDSYHIGFRLAPLINAAGRMGHARLAVELLTSENEMRCFKIAEYLKGQNNQRRQVEKEILKQAMEMIKNHGLDHPDRKTIVLENENWHSGVIGIVASRIVDKFYRPAILINSSSQPAQGSARSIPGFDICKAVKACSRNLISYGGHEMAAGLKIDKEMVPDFADKFEKYAHQNHSDKPAQEQLEIDALCSVKDMSEPLVKELSRFEPFGPGNPRPVFATKGVRLVSPPRKVGQKGEHLQIAIADQTAAVRCIGFRMGQYEKKLLENEYFNIAYEAQMNHYNGNSSVQFVLNDIKFD